MYKMQKHTEKEHVLINPIYSLLAGDRSLLVWSPFINEIICLPLIQAAIGSVSLDMARQKGLTGQIEEEFGIQVLLPGINCFWKLK